MGAVDHLRSNVPARVLSWSAVSKTFSRIFDGLRLLGESRAMTMDDAAQVVTEQTGKMVINPQFDEAEQFADGLARRVRIAER